MFNKKSADAIIIGAGPIGMIEALCLARRGLEVIIIDKADRPCARSNALALHPRTLALLKRLEILEPTLNASYPVTRLQFYDDRQMRAAIDFSKLDTNFPFIATLGQNEFERALESRLEEQGIEILWNHRAVDILESETTATVIANRLSDRTMGYAVSRMDRLVDKTLELTGKIVIAADGYNSSSKRILKAKFQKKARTQQYVMFECESDVDPERCVRISSDNGLIASQYPLKGGFQRFAFQFEGMNVPADTREKNRDPGQSPSNEKDTLDDHHLRDLIFQRAPWNIGYINRLVWKAPIQFESRMISRSRHGHVFFLGDAARTFGPIGYLSMNLAIAEAEKLADTIAVSYDDRLLLDSLDHLSNTFAKDWEVFFDIKKFSLPNQSADLWIAQHCREVIESIPCSADELEKACAQLSIDLKLPNLVET